MIGLSVVVQILARFRHMLAANALSTVLQTSASLNHVLAM
jgi:hypothetical protein